MESYITIKFTLSKDSQLSQKSLFFLYIILTSKYLIQSQFYYVYVSHKVTMDKYILQWLFWITQSFRRESSVTAVGQIRLMIGAYHLRGLRFGSLLGLTSDRWASGEQNPWHSGKEDWRWLYEGLTCL